MGDIHDTTSTHKFKSEPSKKSFDLNDLGEKIHIQNEHGIGGNICVKIVFFCLLALLVGAVGLIYVHSQGSTDGKKLMPKENIGHFLVATISLNMSCCFS